MICPLCLRHARGFAYLNPRDKFATQFHYDSMECMMAHSYSNLPPALDREEHEALGHASDMGGAFVEKLGKTDLATWSPDEWQLLTNEIVLAFTARLRDICTTTDRDIPY